MQWKWKSNHLAAVISIIYVMHLAEPFVLDQDVVITRVTESSVAIMSWSYTGALPDEYFIRRVEKKNSSSFELMLDYLPLTNKTNLFGVFENKNVSYMENTNMLTVTVYDFEEEFHGEYRLTVAQSSGNPAVSGPTIFYLCREPKEANLTGPYSQTLGTDIILICAAESNSLGEEYRKNVTRIYYWKVNNELVVAGDNYEFNNNIEENSVNSSLIIKNIGAKMNGNNYTCFAVEDGCEMDSPLSYPYMLLAEDLPTCQSSCKNGGTCNQATLKCICLDGFTGDTCDKGPDDPGAECKWWCILLIVLPMVIVVIVIICCCWHYKVACFRHKSSAQIDVNQKQETNGFGMENKAY